MKTLLLKIAAAIIGLLLGLAGLFFPVIIDFYTKPSVQMPGDVVNGLALVLFWIFITMPIGGIIFFASLEYLINPKSFEKNNNAILHKHSYWDSVDFQDDGSMMEPSWYMKYTAPNDIIELDGTFSILELELIINHMKKVTKT